METNPCEAISKKTYLPCKLRARQGCNTCTIHKDFFSQTWKEYFIYQQTRPLFIFYKSEYTDLDRLSIECRMGHHVRKTLQEKLVTLTDDDIRLIENEEMNVDLYLCLFELPYFDILNFPEITSRVLSTIMEDSAHVPDYKDLEFKLKPFMENVSLEFTDKLLLICTLAAEFMEEKEWYKQNNKFPNFKSFLDSVFKYYNNEFDNQSKDDVKRYLIRSTSQEMDKLFEENIVPRLSGLR